MSSSDTAVLETIRDAVGHAGADGVFGEPVTHEGVTIVPAAKLSGGGGGGGGEGTPAPGGEGKLAGAMGHGTGGGFGVSAKPMGAFVIKHGRVAWRPAIDVNRVILGGQVVAVAALLTVRAIVQARSRRTQNEQAEAGRRWLRRR
jgi:uncharacterized spore protein YtfJ